MELAPTAGPMQSAMPSAALRVDAFRTRTIAADHEIAVRMTTGSGSRRRRGRRRAALGMSAMRLAHAHAQNLVTGSPHPLHHPRHLQQLRPPPVWRLLVVSTAACCARALSLSLSRGFRGVSKRTLEKSPIFWSLRHSAAILVCRGSVSANPTASNRARLRTLPVGVVGYLTSCTWAELPDTQAGSFNVEYLECDPEVSSVSTTSARFADSRVSFRGHSPSPGSDLMSIQWNRLANIRVSPRSSQQEWVRRSLRSARSARWSILVKLRAPLQKQSLASYEEMMALTVQLLQHKHTIPRWSCGEREREERR